MKNILVEGHRGYCAKYPENTLVSFEAALELGVDAIEFDVWLTTDKVPVLMHDGNAKRTCGVDTELRNMTLAEVKELEPAYRVKFGDQFVGKGVTVPTLEELLKLCRDKRPDIKLGVEIKAMKSNICIFFGKGSKCMVNSVIPLSGDCTHVLSFSPSAERNG